MSTDYLRDGAYTGTHNNSTLLMQAALAYARDGVPVFPIKPKTKAPATKHGFYDATTDTEQIESWWTDSPYANIAFPTGKKTKRIVVDEDAHEAHLGLARPLPKTYTVGTPRDGRHYYYTIPQDFEGKLKSSAGKLAKDVDIRADGGYVVAPPSRTVKGSYTVLDDRPVADAPQWLLEALREPKSEASGSSLSASEGFSKGLAPTDTGPIYEGGRNAGLTSIAGRLHDGTRSLNQLTADLMEVNESCCRPPLPASEVQKIAASVYPRDPSKKAAPEVTPEVHHALDAIEDDMMQTAWRGAGGKSERDVLLAIATEGRMFGTLIPVGVLVSCDYRTLASKAEVSKSTLSNRYEKGEFKPGAIMRLKTKGRLRTDNADRHTKDAGSFVLLFPESYETAHRTDTHPQSLSIPKQSNVCPDYARPSDGTVPRMRNSRPVYDRGVHVGTLSRLGKTKGAILDHLAYAGGTLKIEDVAELLGISRVRDVRNRHILPLVESGVVQFAAGSVSLAEGWFDALLERREADGEFSDHERDVARYDDDRQKYHGSEVVTKDTIDEREDNLVSLPLVESAEKVFTPTVGRNVGYVVTPPQAFDPDAEPCIHSDPLFGHYPGGSGCFLCDAQYPGRHEIIVLDKYRKRRIDRPRVAA